MFKNKTFILICYINTWHITWVQPCFFSGVRVAQSLVQCVAFCRPLLVILFFLSLAIVLQWNLSNPTHHGTRKMCRVVGILRFYFSKQKYFVTIKFSRLSQFVGKFRCRIAQVPLYIELQLLIIQLMFSKLS
jgi:hypothetical protein